jgi:hypothetical protein
MNRNSDENDDIYDVIFMILPAILDERADRIPKMISARTGYMYYNELMSENHNPTRFLDVARMERQTFVTLLHELQLH